MARGGPVASAKPSTNPKYNNYLRVTYYAGNFLNQRSREGRASS